MSVKETRERRYSSSVCNINYHFVWCPKYRKKVLISPFKESLYKLFFSICESKSWEIIELNIQIDHIHLFLSAPPYDSPTFIVQVLKGISSKELFSLFPELRRIYWRGGFWSPSYYVGTAGNMSAQTIKRYIQEQDSKK